MLEKDKIYLKHILDSINDIEIFVSDFTRDAFVNDKKTFNATIRMFEVIGEATKRLSDEIKNSNKQVEWKKIAGLRDVLIHEYEGVDINAVWLIIKNNVPELKHQIQTIINKL